MSNQTLKYSTPLRSHKHICPKCSDQVYRVPRRFIDRLLSHFNPVQRYKCSSPDCAWEGNMSKTPEARTQSSTHMDAEQYQA